MQDGVTPEQVAEYKRWRAERYNESALFMMSDSGGSVKHGFLATVLAVMMSMFAKLNVRHVCSLFKKYALIVFVVAMMVGCAAGACLDSE